MFAEHVGKKRKRSGTCTHMQPSSRLISRNERLRNIYPPVPLVRVHVGDGAIYLILEGAFMMHLSGRLRSLPSRSALQPSRLVFDSTRRNKLVDYSRLFRLLVTLQKMYEYMNFIYIKVHIHLPLWPLSLTHSQTSLWHILCHCVPY
jgi:hypothetical protein